MLSDQQTIFDTGPWRCEGWKYLPRCVTGDRIQTAPIVDMFQLPPMCPLETHVTIERDGDDDDGISLNYAIVCANPCYDINSEIIATNNQMNPIPIEIIVDDDVGKREIALYAELFGRSRLRLSEHRTAVDDYNITGWREKRMSKCDSQTTHDRFSLQMIEQETNSYLYGWETYQKMESLNGYGTTDPKLRWGGVRILNTCSWGKQGNNLIASTTLTIDKITELLNTQADNDDNNQDRIDLRVQCSTMGVRSNRPKFVDLLYEMLCADITTIRSFEFPMLPIPRIIMEAVSDNLYNILCRIPQACKSSAVLMISSRAGDDEISKYLDNVEIVNGYISIPVTKDDMDQFVQPKVRCQYAGSVYSLWIDVATMLPLFPGGSTNDDTTTNNLYNNNNTTVTIDDSCTILLKTVTTTTTKIVVETTTCHDDANPIMKTVMGTTTTTVSDTISTL